MNEVEKVEMTFTATICDESDAETKTILDGQLGDDLRKVLPPSSFSLCKAPYCCNRKNQRFSGVNRCISKTFFSGIHT